ncbi:Hypothetical protein LUCI_0495 [Lucifera butyrica]|uniref:Uncharacterized protein n=1 Tax=Lucifera butyrica TaxID=1351585 RepID=A0A498R821_9FIRM|nr:Hypothetical protein LUCI_0495 [Lucifera butyrica]
MSYPSGIAPCAGALCQRKQAGLLAADHYSPCAFPLSGGIGRGGSPITVARPRRFRIEHPSELPYSPLCACLTSAKGHLFGGYVFYC